MLAMRYLLLFMLLNVYGFSSEVVCIHGFMRHQICMKHMAKKLRQSGHTPIIWGYKSRSKTIEEHSADLVASLKKLEGNGPINFVTHSMGGLIVRAALNHPACPQRAKEGAVIMLAPPNRGSAIARALKGVLLVEKAFGKKAGQQLLNYDQTHIQDLGTFPATCSITCIAGSKDWKVKIEETYLETEHTHHVIECGHTTIMKDPHAIKIVLAAISPSP